MRARISIVLFAVCLTTTAFAKDVYLSVGGSVGNFRTDARIWNPSFDKDITVVARYLPAGNSNNEAVGTTTITVAKRTMAVYDDVVQSLFGGGPALGAVRLTSDDDFVATQRIYADERGRQAGTLGQFVPGLEVAEAKRKGVVVQMKIGPTSLGSFRTNWGGVNPNASVANIAFNLYDRNNALAGTNNLTVQPFGVIGPTQVLGFFGNPSSDLSDSWMTFESDVPIFVYGSVVDNTSTDPTFIPASDDTGIPPVDPPPPPEPKIINVRAHNFEFDVDSTAGLRPGDTVTFRIVATEGAHGFHLTAPNGEQLISIADVDGTVKERTVVIPVSGTYQYFCITFCGVGHNSMSGQFLVSP